MSSPRSDRPHPKSAIQLEIADVYRMGVAEIGKELRTCKANVHRIIKEYASAYPNLWMNYTLVLMLYLRDVAGVRISPEDIFRAAKGELPNLTSVHRALTIAKKLYMDPQQKMEVEAKSEEWRDAILGTFDGEGD